jgi:hypothetical protein
MLDLKSLYSVKYSWGGLFGRERSVNEDRVDRRSNSPDYRQRFVMRLPRMTIRRWVVLIAVAAVDLTLIEQTYSHAVSQLAFFGTGAVVFLSPVMLLLLMLAADD